MIRRALLAMGAFLLAAFGVPGVTIQRNGKRAQVLNGQLLKFDTEPGDVISLKGN